MSDLGGRGEVRWGDLSTCHPSKQNCKPIKVDALGTQIDIVI